MAIDLTPRSVVYAVNKTICFGPLGLSCPCCLPGRTWPDLADGNWLCPIIVAFHLAASSSSRARGKPNVPDGHLFTKREAGGEVARQTDEWLLGLVQSGLAWMRGEKGLVLLPGSLLDETPASTYPKVCSAQWFGAKFSSGGVPRHVDWCASNNQWISTSYLGKQRPRKDPVVHTSLLSYPGHFKCRRIESKQGKNQGRVISRRWMQFPRCHA